MSVFVDTGVFYAHHDTDATRHEVAVESLNEIVQSPEYGHVMTSDYVYDETVTLTHQRTGSVDAGIEVGRRLRGDGHPDIIELLNTSPARFDEAVDVHESYADHELSFTDAVTAVLVDYHDIDAVLSFDDDFDGVTDRLPPATLTD